MSTWTPEKIKKGFERFAADHGRLPKVSEIDGLEYLPSSRFIQKRFGGLEKFREKLGYTDVHFGKGVHRSEIATNVGLRGRQLEIDLELQLQTYFGEICVHTEKTFYGKHRVDFYIYTPDGNFGIDIFYSETMRTLQSSVNIKMKKYQHFTDPLYLTVANKSLKQTDLDTYVVNKKLPFPSNITLVNLSTLHKFLHKLQKHENIPSSSKRLRDIHKKFHGGHGIDDE